MHEAHIHVTCSTDEHDRTKDFFEDHIADVVDGYRGAGADTQIEAEGMIRVSFNFPSVEMRERFCRMEQRALSLMLRHAGINASCRLCADECTQG